MQQGLLNFEPNPIARLVKASLPGIICERQPLGADENQNDAGFSQAFLNDLAEVFARVDLMKIKKNIVLMESLTEPVIYHSGNRPAIISAV